MRKNEDDYEIYKLLKVAESASNWMRNARKSTTDVFKVTLADLLTDLRKDLYDDFHGYL